MLMKLSRFQKLKKICKIDFHPQIVFLLMTCNLKYVSVAFLIYDIYSKLNVNYRKHALYTSLPNK